MLDAELLSILCCPETKQNLRLASDEELAALNRAIEASHVHNRQGNLVDEPADGFLIREDGKVGYLVREDIPVMLIDESISIEPW